MVYAISPIIIESQRPAMSIIAPPNVTDYIMEEFLATWDPSPYTVTPEVVETSWSPRGDTTVTFTSGGEEHPLKCWIVNDDPWEQATRDYIVFQQIYGWFGTKEEHVYLPYSVIAESFSDAENYSRITISLRYIIEIFFWVNSTYDFSYELFANNYNITVGVGMNQTLDSVSPWGMVGKIMSFQLPGTNWVLAAMVATPIYMMLFYIAFAVIRSVIPLLGG